MKSFSNNCMYAFDLRLIYDRVAQVELCLPSTWKSLLAFILGEEDTGLGKRHLLVAQLFEQISGLSQSHVSLEFVESSFKHPEADHHFVDFSDVRIVSMMYFQH